MYTQLFTNYKVHPAVVYHHSTNLLNVTIVTTNTRINNGASITVVVKKFIRGKKVSFAWLVLIIVYLCN